MKSSATEKYLPETYGPLEQEKLKEFRELITDLEMSEEMKHDAQLIRWLRARNLDVQKAYTMLKQSLEWRKENNLDGILEREDVPKEIQEQTPFANVGLDKDGYPIIIMPVGRQDGRTMLEKYGSDVCFRYHLINCEKIMGQLRKLSEEQGRPVTQLVQIIDLEGYNFRQLRSSLCRDFMLNMQTMMDANYPELLRYCLVVNAPKVFYILFNILKPFIPKQTLEKVDIYGPEPEKWKKVVAEKFPVECIPPHWGGTRKGSDKFCSKDDIWVQGPVPVSFFTQESGNEEEENLTTATVNARDSLKINLTVTNPNSSITWRIRCQSHDIGFQILFDGDGSVIVPYQRVQTQQNKQVVEGSQVCEKVGSYTIILDNSYSFARSKTISYNFDIIESEEDVKQINGFNEPVTGKPMSAGYDCAKAMIEIENNNDSQLVANHCLAVSRN